MSVGGDANRAANFEVGSNLTIVLYQMKPAPKAARAPPANAPIVTHTGAPGPHAEPASAPAAMLPPIPAAVVVSSRLMPDRRSPDACHHWMIDALLVPVGDDRARRDTVIYALGENHLSAFAIATSDPFPPFGRSF